MIFTGSDNGGQTFSAEVEHDGSNALRIRYNLIRGKLRIGLDERVSLTPFAISRQSPGSQLTNLASAQRFAVKQVLDPDLGKLVWQLPDTVLLRVSWESK